MEIPTKYVMPCKTNGMCRSNKLHADFPDNPNFPGERVEIGIGLIEFEPFESPRYEESRVTYKCCTGCYLPFNHAEAVRLNEEIGLELPSVDSLRDRMAALKAKARGKSK